ncbi:MAG: hypothetical protein KBE77_01410 [Aliarcobacter sp.]|nr:hypothetical protein [Aliarcobacter sp.]
MNKNIAYYKDLIKKHFISFVISFSFIFSLVLVYAYFAKKVYQSDASVEIVKYKQSTNELNNPLQIAIKESTPEDEAEILKSNFLVNKTVKELGLNIEYYHFYRGKNNIIEKDDFPLVITKFEIKNPALYNQNIQVKQLDEKNYNLVINTSNFMTKIKSSAVIDFNQIYEFGKFYNNDLFGIQVDKKNSTEKETN